jgi:hypothetical protein
MRNSLLAGAALTFFAGAAPAQVLTEWVLFGEPGNQVSTPASNNAAGVTGVAMARGAGVTPSAASNSISASGWNDLALDDYFSFGFDVDVNAAVDLAELRIATRSSGTGPANLALRYSGDGFTSNLATIINSGTFFTNSIIDLSALTGLTGSVEFRVIATDATSAGGGTVGSSGTLRISEYFDGVTFFPVHFTGTVVPTSIATAYCFGDGSGSVCPCGNAGGPGEGCANGLGWGAKLAASGSGSVSAADLVLSGSNLTPGQPGLYFQGNVATAGGNGAHFGDGLRCAGSGVRRLQVRSANAMGVSNTTIDIATKGLVVPGNTKYYQLWYRDPAGSPCGTTFNLTHGVSVVWTP